MRGTTETVQQMII